MAGTATTEDGLCCVCDLLLYILFVFVPSRLGQSSSSSSSSQKPAFPFLFRFDCPHPHHKTNEFITLQNDLKWLPHTVRNLLHISSMMVAVAAVAAAQVDAIPIAYSHTIDSSKHTSHTLTHIPVEITAEFIPPKLKNTISEPKKRKARIKKNICERRPTPTGGNIFISSTKYRRQYSNNNNNNSNNNNANSNVAKSAPTVLCCVVPRRKHFSFFG